MEIKIIDLPKITDPRGNLTFAEAQTMVPFDIKRAYWVYDVPGGESRGGHAHKQLWQFSRNARRWPRTSDRVAESSLAGFAD